MKKYNGKKQQQHQQQLPVILFVIANPHKIPLNKTSHMWLACQVGFRSYFVDWRNIEIDIDHTIKIKKGYEILSKNKRRHIRKEETIKPDVVFHRKRIWNRTEKLFFQLTKTFPDAQISYHPTFKHFCKKWNTELYLSENESAATATASSSNIIVPRPKTYLFSKKQLPKNLLKLGKSKKLIIKPSEGSKCLGIRISSPENIKTLSDRITTIISKSSIDNNYVIQELIEDSVLYHGRKFDLRIFAMITSFKPLRYKLYKEEGIARIAAKQYSKSDSYRPSVSLTGTSFRKRYQLKNENIPVSSSLLPYLSKQGYDMSDFWDKVDFVVKNVFTCMTNYCIRNNDLKNHFFLAGIDLLIKDLGGKGKYDILFLEMNHIPALNGWGIKSDRAIQSTHKEWLNDLRKLI